jgi:hypothetical protein
MPLNPQTSQFPPISTLEQSWDENIVAALGALNPGVGVRRGLKMLPPLVSGQPTTGLLPTLTAGVLCTGDYVAGPNPNVISVATANWANKNFYIGLSGGYWADTPTKPNDILVASVSTDNLNPAAITSIAQPMHYGAGRFGLRGVVNLARCAKGADTLLFTWVKPTELAAENLRISHAMVRTVIAPSAGVDAGDAFALKAGAVTLATLANTDISATGNQVVGSPAATWNYLPSVANIPFRFNLTDGSTAMTGGMAEFMVILETY